MNIKEVNNPKKFRENIKNHIFEKIQDDNKSIKKKVYITIVF